MTPFRIVPLSAAFAHRIRTTKQDDYGHAVAEQVATGKGPCRVSLKPFEVGKEVRLLLTHSPFEIDNAYNQPGPIFISSENVEPYQDVHRFPPEIKADKKSFTITLLGYSTDQQMLYTRLVKDEEDIDLLIPQIFEKYPEVEYLHARSAKACCYICRIERA